MKSSCFAFQSQNFAQIIENKFADMFVCPCVLETLRHGPGPGSGTRPGPGREPLEVQYLAVSIPFPQFPNGGFSLRNEPSVEVLVM